MAAITPTTDSPSPPPFLEVNCKISGKKSRFAAGTKAGFAVSLMNRKLESASSIGEYIEAVKEGEEPISFGHDAVLVNFGDGWKLQTVIKATYAGIKNKEGIHQKPTNLEFVEDHLLSLEKGTKQRVMPGNNQTRTINPEWETNYSYFGKIFIAFVFMFVVGTMFTLALENLPKLILFVNSYDASN